MDCLGRKFEIEAAEAVNPQVLVTAVKLPTGAIEVITNTQNLPEKIKYLIEAYDIDFKLIANPNVQIVGYMLI
jgi:hypothetical protein